MARGKKKETLTPEERLQAALVPESEQPYKVPGNWTWVKVGDLCTFIGGGTPDKTNPLYWNGNISWASVKDIKGSYLYSTIDKISQLGLESSSSNLCEAGDLLLVTRIEPAKTIVSKIVTAINQDIKIVKSELSSLFLYHYFCAFQHEFEKKASGSTVKGITLPNIQNTPFPLPPLPEQQRIVDGIESLFAKLDEAKQNVQDALDNFETRKAAILHKAFTGELTAQWRKEHDVGMESWEEKTINDIGDVKGGKRIPKGMELTYENTGHPYLKAGNLKQGTVIASGMMYVTDEILECIKNYTVSAGDVYITNVGACIGDCGIIPPEYDGANLTENAVKITNLKCNNKWLSYYLSGSSVQQNIKSMIASATLGKLSIANIKKIELNIPTSLDEQIEIVCILDNLFAKEQQAKDAAEGVLEQIDLIKKAILARAFRGELGTNDPSEESAVELLKQVL